MDRGWPLAHDPLKGCQRLRDDLIHVVVLVRRKPAHEVHAMRRRRECVIALVQGRVLRSGDRVVRISLSPRILGHERRLWMLLARQMLELRNACVSVVVRVVHHRHGL